MRERETWRWRCACVCLCVCVYVSVRSRKCLQADSHTPTSSHTRPDVGVSSMFQVRPLLSRNDRAITTLLCASLGHAIQRQKLLSNPCFGAPKASLHKALLLRRSAFVHRHRYHCLRVPSASARDRPARPAMAGAGSPGPRPLYLS